MNQIASITNMMSNISKINSSIKYIIIIMNLMVMAMIFEYKFKLFYFFKNFIIDINHKINITMIQPLN